MKRSHLFISHAKKDLAFAELVVSKIRDEKMIQPWIDTQHITTGTNILAALRDGLTSMDIFVVLISTASLVSAWVKEEVECALRKQIEGESLLVLPFIIDGTLLKDLETLHPFLLTRRVDRVRQDRRGASSIINAIREATGLPLASTPPPPDSKFKSDPEIEEIVRDVRLGNWDAALDPAFTILAATDSNGGNELFRRLARYQECPNEDLAWGARMTMETLVDLAPELFDRRLLAPMSQSSDFSIRASAASICLILAQFAPDRVPLDVAMKLARYDEDWYVTEPATAALKSICKARRNVLHFFFKNLQDADAQGRAHAARAIRGIAAKEPGILEPDHLQRAIGELRRIGDQHAEEYIAEAWKRVRAAKFEDGYRYGLGG